MKNIVVILCILLLFVSASSSRTSQPNKTGEQVNLTVPEETEWKQAKEMILDGKVESLTQAHDRTVILTLKDGSQFTTKEPVLDDIFRLLQQCGAKCSEIIIATE